LPFCGNASNANNEATWTKNKKQSKQGPQTDSLGDFQASSLVGSDLKQKNAKKDTDNGFPPAAKITCRYM
jgi:hypothetical protein